MAAAAFLAVCVPKCGWTRQAELMRVIVTRIGLDGTWVAGWWTPRASGDAGPLQELIARAPWPFRRPCRPVPEGLVCHLRAANQAILIAGGTTCPGCDRTWSPP
jgi:hypothetical protein